MGLLDLILGKSNPASQFVDSNPYMAPAIGGGIASGTSLGGGFANAAQNMAAAKQADLQYGLQQQQLQLAVQGRNATADWLAKQPNPQLAAMAEPVRNGTLAGGDVLKMAFGPGPSVAPGATVLPNPLSPSYAGPSSQASAPATNDAAMAPPVGPNAPTLVTQAPSASTPITSPASAAAFYQGMTPNAPIPPPTAQVASNAPAGIPSPSSVPLAPWSGTVPAGAASQLMHGLNQQPSPVPLAPIAPTTSAPQPAPQVAQGAPVYDPSKPFKATATNPLYMTPQERQDLGKQWGLSGAPLMDFTVSGRMPLRVGAGASPMRPATAADKAAYGISPNDPGVYMVNTATNAIQKIAGATAASAQGADVAPPPVELGPDGRPDPTQQQQYIKSLPPGLATMVKGVSDYTIDPMRSTSIRGDQRQALITAVKQYDPTYDQTQFQARAAMRKSVTSGTYSQAINSANLVIQHLDAVAKAADELHNSGSPVWNAVSNVVKQQTGQPQVVAFNVAADAAATELAKVFKGTGSTSDSEIKTWRANLDPNSSPEQIHAAIDSAVTNLLASRLDTIRTQYASAMGKPADFRLLTNHSAQVLQNLGVDTSMLDPNATTTPSPAAPATGAPDVQSLLDKYK